MLGMINHMTDKEKQAVKEQIEYHDLKKKEDLDAIVLAMDEDKSLMFDTLVNILWLKNEVCRKVKMKEPIVLTKADYINIGKIEEVEARRKELVKALRKNYKLTTETKGNNEMTNGNIDTRNIDTTRLSSFIAKIERLNEEKANINNDLKEVYKEAKLDGFPTKALKTVIKLKAISENPTLKNKEEEEKYWIEVFKNALGLGE